MKRLGIFLWLMAFSTVAAQTIVVHSAQGPVNLTPNPAMVTFVTSTSESIDGALKDTAISAAQGQAVAAVAGRLVPIPIIGPTLVGGAMSKLHLTKPISGYSVAFVKGFASTASIAPGLPEFSIPTQYLEGATPALLRLKPSAKDSNRLVRSLHLSVKVTGATITPDARNATLLGADQDVVASHSEPRGEDILVIPEAPLEKGEYAVVLLPPAGSIGTPVNVIWDFHVDPKLTPPPPPPPPVAPASITAAPVPVQTTTVSVGQTIAAVQATLGKPERTVKFGNKDIYFFKDFKVTFVNGKVTDIQ